MPLRDHQRRPYDFVPFEGVHGGWPMVMLYQILDKLPPGYSGAPQVGLGTRLEFDLAAYADRTVGEEAESGSPVWTSEDAGNGGGAVAVARPEPS